MKHPLENGHIKHGQKKQATHHIWTDNIIQEVAGVVNVPQNKGANALDITASSFQKIIGLSGTGENVLTLLKIT
jgi:hypothetical protein